MNSRMVYRPPVRTRLSPTSRRRVPVRVASPPRRNARTTRTMNRSSPASRRRVPVRATSPTRRTTRTMNRSSPTRRTTRTTRSTRTMSRSSPRKGGKNAWIKFLKAHKGQGYDVKRLAEMYRRQR